MATPERRREVFAQASKLSRRADPDIIEQDGRARDIIEVLAGGLGGPPSGAAYAEEFPGSDSPGFTPCDFDAVKLDGVRPSSGLNTRWHFVEKDLAQRGLELRRRRHDGPSHEITGRFPDLYVYEVSNVQGVIAEGRGLDADGAKIVALAEAVERVLGTGIAADAPVLATASELRLQGLTVPRFKVGPRDGFSDELVTLWSLAFTPSGRAGAVPVDLAYFGHLHAGYFQSFALSHSCGLAAGRTLEEAAMAACLEVVERDAYWIAMTCRPELPIVNSRALAMQNTRLERLLDIAAQSGLKAHFKNLQMDWPVPVVHVVLEDLAGHLPAFSHGVSANPDLGNAAAKALEEAFQLRSCQLVALTGHVPSAVLPNVGREPMLAWSDPAFRPAVAHLLTDDGSAAGAGVGTEPPSAAELLRAIEAVGGNALICDLGSIGDLHVVRAILPEAVPPNPFPWEIAHPRLGRHLRKNGLRHPYSDPILT